MIAYYLYRLGFFLANRLPLKFCFVIATFLSVIKYHLSPRDRRAVVGNLKKILPLSEQSDIARYAKDVFVNFGKYMIEFFRFSLLTKSNLKQYITIEGLNNVDAALAKKKGAIVLAVHIGNWELGGVAMALMGYPMVGVALPHQHRKVNAFFNNQRERLGMSVIPSTGMSIRRIYKALADNKLVALVSDRDFANTGKSMDFLGAKKVIPRGPAVLSMRTGAAIIPGFVIRKKDDTQILKFLQALEPSHDENILMQQYKKIIEDVIREYPSQWLMFREFWKE